MKANNSKTPFDRTTSDSSFGAPDSFLDVDYYLRKAVRAFRQSNNSIERAAKRAREPDELKKVVSLAEEASILADRLGKVLEGIMNTEQQAIYDSIQRDAKETRERIEEMLKTRRRAPINEADQHNQSAKSI